MAICDANYCFTLFDIGQYGSNNDSGVLINSKMGKMFENNELEIPVKSSINKYTLPYFLLGDVIFPLKQWLMRPYPGKKMQRKKKEFIIIVTHEPNKTHLEFYLLAGESFKNQYGQI